MGRSPGVKELGGGVVRSRSSEGPDRCSSCGWPGQELKKAVTMGTPDYSWFPAKSRWHPEGDLLLVVQIRMC